MVLDRRMFRRPSQMAPQRGPSSRGVGITSGLTQPVQKFNTGDFAQTVKSTREDLLPVLREYFPAEDFFDRAGTSPLKFFAALGSPMAPGQTVLGKIGEAGQFLDIKPEGDRAGALATDLALQAGLKTLEKDDDAVERKGFSSFEKPIGDGMFQRFTSFVEDGQIVELPVGEPYRKDEEDDGVDRENFSNYEKPVEGENMFQRFTSFLENGEVKEFPIGQPYEKAEDDAGVTRENFSNYELPTGDGFFQRYTSFLEDGVVKNFKVGVPYQKELEETKPFEFQEKLNSLEEMMKNAKNDEGGDLYTEADINAAKIDLITRQTNLSFEEELALVEANLDANTKAEYAAGELAKLNIDLDQLNKKEQNLTTRRNVLDAAITDPTLYDTRVAIANFFETFPGLKTTLGPTYDKITEFITMGQAVPTQALQTLANQSILDVAAGGAIPGNFNTKEFEAVIGAAGPAYLNRDAQEFIINLNLADVRIQKEVKAELDRLMLTDKTSLEVIKEVNDFKNKLYQDYRNSQEYANGIELLTNIGKAKTPDYFLTLGNITIRGQELNMTELYKNNKVALAGYSDSNGLFVSRTGYQVSANPNQPIYAVIIGKAVDPKDNVKKDVVRYYAADQF